jgi:hypothetical protein
VPDLALATLNGLPTKFEQVSPEDYQMGAGGCGERNDTPGSRAIFHDLEEVAEFLASLRDALKVASPINHKKLKHAHLAKDVSFSRDFAATSPQIRRSFYEEKNSSFPQWPVRQRAGRGRRRVLRIHLV